MEQMIPATDATTTVARRRAIIALLALVPAPTIGVLFAMAIPETRGTPLGKSIYAASKLWILLVPVIWLLFIERRRLSFSPLRHGGLGAGLFLGIAIAAIVLLAGVLLGDAVIEPTEMRAAAERNGLGEPVRYVVFAAYLTLINSLLEEYVWRWFVFRKCEEAIGRPGARARIAREGIAAVCLSALFFTLHHFVALKSQTTWPAALLGSLGVFIGGCAWSWLYWRYRSIWPGYLSHVIVDVAVLALGWQVIFSESAANMNHKASDPQMAQMTHMSVVGFVKRTSR